MKCKSFIWLKAVLLLDSRFWLHYPPLNRTKENPSCHLNHGWKPHPFTHSPVIFFLCHICRCISPLLCAVTPFIGPCHWAMCCSPCQQNAWQAVSISMLKDARPAWQLWALSTGIRQSPPCRRADASLLDGHPESLSGSEMAAHTAQFTAVALDRSHVDYF